EFAGELTLLKSIPPRIDETDCDFEEDIRLIDKLLYDNSFSRPLKEFVSANSDATSESFSPSPILVKDSDSLKEEIDLFCTPDYPMPPGIMDEDYDSERDILIPKDLPRNNTLSFAEKKKAIERLKQGESINVQDLETNLYWEFRKFTSRDGESLESYYLRFYKMMNELVRNQFDVTNHQVNVQSQQAATRNKGKVIANSPPPVYDQEPAMVAEYDEMSKDKEIEQADWRDDTNDESEDQELEAHYMYMAQIQEVTPDATDNSRPIFDTEPLQK
nr:hypothetical protein [Tanacetum cinerariifolium]